MPFFATLHQGGAPQNVFDRKADKAISNQDLPQNFVLSYIYELPLGKNKKFFSQGSVVDKVVGGWSISGIQRYESGQPIAFACATAPAAYANCIRFNHMPGHPFRVRHTEAGAVTSFPSRRPIMSADRIGFPIFNPLDTATGAVNPAFDDPNSAANLAANTAYTFGTSSDESMGLFAWVLT